MLLADARHQLPSNEADSILESLSFPHQNIFLVVKLGQKGIITNLNLEETESVSNYRAVHQSTQYNVIVGSKACEEEGGA